MKPFYRRSGGVTRVVRDNYGGLSWYEVCGKVRKRDQYKCIFCGTPENHKMGIYHDVHHLKELSRGGTTTMANLGLTCDTCHKRRHPHMRKNSR